MWLYANTEEKNDKILKTPVGLFIVIIIIIVVVGCLQ